MKSIFDDLEEEAIQNPIAAIEEVIQKEEPQEVEIQEDEVEEGNDVGDEVEVEDENVMALYNYLNDNELIPEIENFKGSPTQLQEHLNKLPETYLNAAIQATHPDSADLLTYAFQLGDKADRTKLKEFFDQYVNVEEVDINNEDVAYSYLEEKLISKPGFKNPAKLAAYLDSHVEDGTLLDLAKEIKEEEDAVKLANKQKEIDLANANKLAQEEAQREFFTNLRTELDTYDWKKEKKEAILKNLEPKEATRKNQLIANSPKALIQLADIYTRFNEKTGEFDLSDLELKAKSKSVQKELEKLQKDKLTSYLNKSVNRKAVNEKEGFLEQFKPI